MSLLVPAHPGSTGKNGCVCVFIHADELTTPPRQNLSDGRDHLRFRVALALLVERLHGRRHPPLTQRTQQLHELHALGDQRTHGQRLARLIVCARQLCARTDRQLLLGHQQPL